MTTATQHETPLIDWLTAKFGDNLERISQLDKWSAIAAIALNAAMPHYGFIEVMQAIDPDCNVSEPVVDAIEQVLSESGEAQVSTLKLLVAGISSCPKQA